MLASLRTGTSGANRPGEAERTEKAPTADLGLTVSTRIGGTMVAMTSSSPKLLAMREWVAALKAYDEVQAPYQLPGSDRPPAEVTARLDELSAVVQLAYERYQSLSWSTARSGAA